jgi:hypothetical protein
MKLHHVELEGASKAMRVHMFIGDDPTPESSRQWLECKVEVPVKGTMDIEAVQKAALLQLRNVVDAQIAALPPGGL